MASTARRAARSRPPRPAVLPAMRTEMDRLQAIRFIRHRPRSHRRHFITEEDVRILLGRLPPDLWARLRAVHFNDRALGRAGRGTLTSGTERSAFVPCPTVSASAAAAGEPARRNSATPRLSVAHAPRPPVPPLQHVPSRTRPSPNGPTLRPRTMAPVRGRAAGSAVRRPMAPSALVRAVRPP